MGNQPGTVEIEFEAYYIPDSMDIKNSSAATVWSTPGKVTGYTKTSTNFPGRSDGKAETWKVTVEGNSDPETRWTATVGCPGQDLTDKERYKARRTLSGSYGPPNNAAVKDVFCAINAYLDGQAVYKSGYKLANHNFSFVASTGKHIYSWEMDCDYKCNFAGCQGNLENNSIRYGAQTLANPGFGSGSIYLEVP